MEQDEFLRVFGDSIRRRRATVFVGAGVSLNSGYPNWVELVRPLKEAAKVPDSVQDPTLVAEYALQHLETSPLERLLLEQLQQISPTKNDILEQLLSIDFGEIWTTNFDTLIEDTVEELNVIVTDADYGKDSRPDFRWLTKLHGSLSRKSEGPIRWADHPVIARSHFEQFEQTHPLKWAMLRAQFLTSSFLFLGFSFTDPNVNALLRIVRSLPVQLRRQPHFAIMKIPNEEEREREFELFRKDLEAAGVYVITVDNYDDIPGLLRSLSRHSLPPTLFLSGRIDDKNSSDVSVCKAIGSALTGTRDDLILLSYGGHAAQAVMSAYKMALPPDKYKPERVRTYYRRSPTNDEKIEVQRFGTAVFTEKSLGAMRMDVFSQIKALVLIGDGDRSHDEAELAIKLGIPLVPVASGA